MAQPAERISTVPITKMMNICGLGLPRRAIQAHEAHILMRAGENSRQFFGGPRMKANAIGEPSPTRHQPLRQLIARTRQRHAGLALHSAHGGWEIAESPLIFSHAMDSTPRGHIALHDPPSGGSAAPHATATRATWIPRRSARAAANPHRAINPRRAFVPARFGACPTVRRARAIPDRAARLRSHRWWRALR